MWYALIIFILGIVVAYVVAINLEKAVYKVRKKKTKNDGYVSRRQRMKEYNKRERNG